jgi:hypothetical protein
MKTTPHQVIAATAHVSSWASYAGAARIVLAIVLLAVAAGVTYAATRLPLSARPPRPTRAARTIRVVTWLFSIAVLAVCLAVDLVHMHHEHVLHALPADPIAPVTFTAVVVTFFVVLFAGGSYDGRAALASAIIGAMAAPMIFEFPFDLIVMARTSLPVPDAALYRALFFAPALLVEVTTVALLTLSPMVRLSKAAFFFFALMLGVFAVWALTGFGYPSAPVPIALNMASKILAFAATLSLFLPQRAAARPPRPATSQATSPSTGIMQVPAARASAR